MVSCLLQFHVKYSHERGGYSFKTHSGQYVTYLEHHLQMNTKLTTGDKPRYFKIEKHEYQVDDYVYVGLLHFKPSRLVDANTFKGNGR